MNHPRIGRAVLATLAGTAVALTAAPVASAAQHTGCYRPTADRVLRIIPKAQACLKGERRISWNNTRTGSAARGPRGLPGTSGAKGEAGAKGDQGDAGAQGLKGVRGEAGAPGQAGATGAQGAQGATGAEGAPGAQGPQGPQGLQGPQGNTVTGPQGPAGAEGPEGPQGPAGAAGQAGQPGAPGADGQNGAPGAGTIFSSSSGAPTAATTVLGGILNTVSLLPPHGVGATAGVTVNGGTIATDPSPAGFDPGQVMARNGTITAISARIKTSAALSLIGSTLTPTVSVWKSSDVNAAYTPIPGATVTMAPSFTGLLTMGTTAGGITTGLSIPVNAGDRLIVVYRADVTAGIDVATTLTANVTASIAVS